MAWRAVARHAKGKSHEKQQMPCQDFGDCRIFNNVIVGAVADGAGSAKYSDIGATLAVRISLTYLGRMGEFIQKRKRWWQRFYEPFS